MSRLHQLLLNISSFFQGQKLAHGTEEKYYNVTIGGNLCKIVAFHANHIECEPPETQPEAEFHLSGSPRVLVWVLS